MNAILWSVGWPIATSAGVVTIVGVVIAIWSRVALGVYWSGNVVVKEGHMIVERGPYRLVRHPIYLGVLLMLFGTALLWGVGGGIALFCMAFAGLGAKAFLEERLLGECFPAEYGAYKARVKHALVPWLL
jgi:protein-S-isoprenylcysteine O-methyltransferase